MGKYYCKLIILLIIANSSVSAQSNDNSQTNSTKCNLGFEAALCYSEYLNSGSPSVIWENIGIIGGDAGAYLNISSNDKFIFQPELHFSVKGGKATYYTNDYPLQSIYAYSHTSIVTTHEFFIEIPLRLKYYINKSFFLIGGPYIGICIAYTYYQEANTTRYGVITTQPTVSGISATSNEPISNIIELGGDLGAGIKVENGLNLGLKISYSSFGVFSTSPFGNISAGFFAEYGLK